HGECVLFTRMPCALDELNDTDTLSITQHAQRQSERRGGLALAWSRIDDEQPFLDRLFRHLGVLYGLAALHLGLVTAGGFWIDLFHFTLIGRPATVRITLSAAAATVWLRRPAWSRNARASALSGTMPSPTSLATTTHGPRGDASTSASPR